MQEVMQQPEDPDSLSRKAGKDLYGTAVGMLRRVELWRLGNAWGFEFPNGASKDFMLPFFMQLESEGKNPFQPPNGKTLDEIARTREVSHKGKSVAENDSRERALEAEGKPMLDKVVEPITPSPDVIQPREKTEFEVSLEKAPMQKVRALCKLRDIPYSTKDKKVVLIDRIMENIGGSFVKDTTRGR